MPLPPIWWHPIDYWPSVIRYLPDAPVKISLPEDETEILEALVGRTKAIVSESVSRGFIKEPRFSTVLNCADGLDSIILNGESEWAREALVFQDKNIPYPKWIADREAELRERFPGTD